MALYINLVVLCGTLGKDPEMRTLEGGAKKAGVSMVTTESWKDKGTQEWQEKATWHNIIAWRGQAEQLMKAKKGTKITVTGKINNRTYTDRDGNEKFITEIVADSIVLHSPPANSGSATSQNNSGGGGGATAPDTDDDLPF